METYKYFISTEKHSYNSVRSAEHFAQVRRNRNDNTPVVDAFEYSNDGTLNWTRIDTSDFQPVQ